MFLLALNANASGDPSIIYYVVGGGVIQLVGFVYLLTSIRANKVLAGVAYIIFYALVWYWWLNSTTGELVIVALPVTFIVLRFVYASRMKKT